MIEILKLIIEVVNSLIISVIFFGLPQYKPSFNPFTCYDDLKERTLQIGLRMLSAYVNASFFEKLHFPSLTIRSISILFLSIKSSNVPPFLCIENMQIAPDQLIFY
jgi:hypothetical protein